MRRQRRTPRSILRALGVDAEAVITALVDNGYRIVPSRRPTHKSGTEYHTWVVYEGRISTTWLTNMAAEFDELTPAGDHWPARAFVDWLTVDVRGTQEFRAASSMIQVRQGPVRKDAA
jgi:hypothetical protein